MKVVKTQKTDNIYKRPVGTYAVVYVSSDGNSSDTPEEGYEKRTSYMCPKCRTLMMPHFGKPLASCECGTAEWSM